MLHTELISSLQNPKIKHINRLIDKSADRKSEGGITGLRSKYEYKK